MQSLSCLTVEIRVKALTGTIRKEFLKGNPPPLDLPPSLQLFLLHGEAISWHPSTKQIRKLSTQGGRDSSPSLTPSHDWFCRLSYQPPHCCLEIHAPAEILSQ